MAQFIGVPGPSQDEFDALSGQVTTLDSKIDFGMYSTLPTELPTSGVVGFGLSSNVTLDGQFIPAGARFVGYMNNHIGHFTVEYNGADILVLRHVAGTWSLLYSVNSKLTWNYINSLQNVNDSLQFPSDAKEILFVQYNSSGGTAFASLCIPNNSMPSSFAIYSEAGHAIVSRSSSTLTLTSNTDSSIIKVYSK